MTPAELQARLDARGEVIGDGEMDLRSWGRPLRIGNDTALRWHGAILAPIKQPAIMPRTDQRGNHWHVIGPYLEGGGIFIPPQTPTFCPGHFSIEHVAVNRAPVAFEDVGSGAWQSRWIGCRAMNCRVGLRAHGGTTRLIENFHASGEGCEVALDIAGTQTTILRAASFDGHVSQGQPIASFRHNRSLLIEGLHYEQNVANSGSLVLFENNTGHCKGLLSLASVLRTNGTAVHNVELAANRMVFDALSVGAADPQLPDRADATKGGGYAISLVIHGAERSANRFHESHILNARGGTYALANIGARPGSAIVIGPTNAVDWAAVYDPLSEIRRTA